MSLANTATRYGAVTKLFHWATALLILVLIPLGAIANRLPYETDAQLALKAQLFSVHKTLGVAVFLVALARILWALTQTKPGELHPDRRAENALASLVHWLLYISLVAVPLTGWIHHAATSGFAPILLPLGQDLPLVPKNESVSELFATLHWIWSKVMIAAIGLHIAGAFKHLIVDKDSTLQRMWFGATEHLPEVTAHKGSWAAPLTALIVFGLATGAGAMGGMFHHDGPAATVALADVSSEWTVTEGRIEISVTQLGSPVTGQFEDWTSAINFDPEGTGTLGDVTTTVAIGSLKLGSVTDQAMGADFFDVADFPTATFAANITADGTSYLADGTLTIKGNTVPVSMPFVLSLNGNNAEMAGSLSLDRRDFQIGQSMGDESNLGFGVSVNVNLQATRGE
ncbi:cytochrome b/b6 domain-containing protein [Loktanella agnita]|uniref:cytochrome b/b6 domain-containing protein n=1 Tax=Loktanella agnita TaxID=287097 RepID=UPI003987E310